MKLSRKVKIIGVGNDCPKCGKPMERRKHTIRPNKSYFYTEWDVCHNCRHIQHYEEFKSSGWQEDDQQASFFNSIQ